MPRLARKVANVVLPAIFGGMPPPSVYGQPRVGTPPFVPDNVLAPEQDPAPAPPVIVPSQGTPKPTLAEQAISRAVPVEENAGPAKPPPLSAPLWDRNGNPINRGDLPPTTLDEKTGAPAPNMLAPEMASSRATPSLEPIASRSGQIMDEYATRPARRVETDKRGRPTPNIALEGDEQTLDYQDRLARMPEDTEGGGWWPKIRAAIAGFAAGGPVGAAAAFGTRSLREHFDPTLGSREYKAERMAQNAPAVDQIRQSRKDRLSERSTEANIDLARARTDALKNPRQNARIIERKDGVYVLNPKTGKFEKAEEIPPETDAPSNARYFKAGNGEVWKVDAANPEGVRVRNIPGSPGKDTEDVSFSNAQIERSIREAQQEQATIDKWLPGVPQTIEATDILTGTKKMVPNPEYTYNMTRRRQLDDQIRRWRTQLKAPKKKATASATVEDDDPLGILNDEEDEP